jgi:hypothetical protein
MLVDERKTKLETRAWLPLAWDDPPLFGAYDRKGPAE